MALTDSIPNDTVTFRRGLPAEVQNSLVSALEKFSGSKDGQAVLRELYDIDGLTRATKADYDIVRQTLKTLGKDPGQFFKN